jgi:threonine-phosphate decarboxylase
MDSRKSGAGEEGRASENAPGLDGIKVVGVDRTHGGAVPNGAIDFSASINPLGPPRAALQEYHAAAAVISSYPPAYPEKLSARLAEWLGIGREKIIVGNGSTQLIHLFARVHQLAFPYVAIPTFSEIANAFVLNNCIPYALELTREHAFMIRLDQVRHALRHRAQAIFIGRPNSPTGSMIPLTEAEEIARECELSHAFCVYDEAFIDFADRAESAARLMRTIPERRRQSLVVIGSLTKIFAIPGLRVGFLAGPSAMIEKLRDHLEPWSLNVVAERVALACLERADEFCRRTREWLLAERAGLREQLSAIAGVQVFPSVANFLMLQVDESAGGPSFGEFMLQNRIAVRDLRAMPGCGPGLYRVAVRLHDDNASLIAAARAYSAGRGDVPS